MIRCPSTPACDAPAAAARLRAAGPALAVLLLGLTAGCGKDLDTLYGSRQELNDGHSSVNGTAVLADMFAEAGHRVSSTGMLTPRTGRGADVIVWFPQDFSTPDPKARTWFDNWLNDRPGRTLVYVGRDYDSEPHYWAKVAGKAPPAVAREVRSRATTARGNFLSQRTLFPAGKQDCGWFVADRTIRQRSVRSLGGDPNWTRGVNAAAVEIELYGRISPSGDNAEILLDSPDPAGGRDVLVLRRRVGRSQIIVVANGSFLLNYPLINREHRKLAGSLIREVGDPEYVVFLESEHAPLVSDTDPVLEIPTGLEQFEVPPISYLLLHFSLLAILFCFSRVPIFGIAQGDEETDSSDFGKHVDAVGGLLAGTRDLAFAQERLRQYRQAVRDHSGPRWARAEGRPPATTSPPPAPPAPASEVAPPKMTTTS